MDVLNNNFVGMSICVLIELNKYFEKIDFGKVKFVEMGWFWKSNFCSYVEKNYNVGVGLVEKDSFIEIVLLIWWLEVGVVFLDGCCKGKWVCVEVEVRNRVCLLFLWFIFLFLVFFEFIN